MYHCNVCHCDVAMWADCHRIARIKRRWWWNPALVKTLVDRHTAHNLRLARKQAR